MAKKKKPDNLAICAMAAQARHMTYGKYMALPPEERENPSFGDGDLPRPDGDGDAVCADCGKRFWMSERFVHYCPDCNHRRRSEASKRGAQKKKGAAGC